MPYRVANPRRRHSFYFLLVIGAIAGILALGVAVTSALSHNQDAINGLQTDTVALCALRADIQHRVDASVAFLVTHPHGIPGISAAQIQQGIQNEQSTLKALHVIHCQ